MAALLKCLFSALAMEMSSCLDKRVRRRGEKGEGRARSSNEASPACAGAALQRAGARFMYLRMNQKEHLRPFQLRYNSIILC